MYSITDRRSQALILITLAMFAGLPLQAQSTVETTPVIVVGDTLRVWAPASRLDGAMGTLARLSLNGLVLAGARRDPSSPGPELVVPLANITKAEVLRAGSRSMRGGVTGAVIGLAAGALIGAPLGPIIECGGACDKSGNLKPMVGRGLGAAIGGAIGGIIGGVIGGHARTRWHSVGFTVR